MTVASATPGANRVPKALASGYLDARWLAASMAAGVLLYGGGSGATPMSALAPPAVSGSTRYALSHPGGAVAPSWSALTAWTDKANTFTAAQTIDLGTGALPAPTAVNTPLRFAGADTTANILEAIAYGGTAFNVRSRAIGGTRAGAAGTLATAAQQAMFALSGMGHNGTLYVNTNQAQYQMRAASLWSGTNYETEHLWIGTPSGSTTSATWMQLTGGSLGLAVAPTTGNGLFQRASGTTKAYGDAWGTDCFIYRSAAGQLTQLGTAGFLVQQAATQDAIIVLGRAGGTSSYAVTLTPAPMTASYTLTIPALAANDALPTLGLANIFTNGQVIDLGTGALPAVIGTGTTGLRMSNADGVGNRQEVISFGVTTTFTYVGRNVGGARSLNTGTLTGGRFFNFAGFGHDGTNLSTTSNFNFIGAANGNWSGANRGTILEVDCTLNGATAIVFGMSLGGTTGTDPGPVLTLGSFATYLAGNGLIQLLSGTTQAYGIMVGDVGIFRNAANGLTINATAGLTLTGNLNLGTAGLGLLVKEGSNATMGAGTLVGGTVTISTTKVTANSRIFLSVQSQGGTAGFVEVTARVAATSFTITSSSALDTSIVAWVIIEPA